MQKKKTLLDNDKLTHLLRRLCRYEAVGVEKGILMRRVWHLRRWVIVKCGFPLDEIKSTEKV